MLYLNIVLIFFYIGYASSEFFCPKAFGLFKNSDSCVTFYQCEKNLPFLKTCGQGLYFNPKTEICDWPENVECIEPARSSSFGILTNFECSLSGLFEDPVSCSHYVECNNKKGYRKNCPKGLYFNINLGACDWPRNTNCNKNNDIVTKATIEDKKTTKIPKKILDETCPWCFKCPSIDGYYKNEYDDKTYYHCFKGESILFYCSENTVYFENEKKCNKKKSDVSFLIDARKLKKKN